MSTQFIDLRKYNITNEADLLEFLELIIKKLPKAMEVIKKQRMTIISQNNQLQFERNKNGTIATNLNAVDDSSSVLERMTNPRPAAPAGPDRLAQMRAANTEDVTPLGATLAHAGVMQPSSPGEIGQLQVENIAPTLPLDTPAPALDGQLPLEEVADEAAGSKSELASNSDNESEMEETIDEQAIAPEDETPESTPVQGSGAQEDPAPTQAQVPTVTSPVKKSVKKK